MAYPPSYKTTSSEEHLAAIANHLTVDEKRDLTAAPSSITSVNSKDSDPYADTELSRDLVVADDYNAFFHATKTLTIHAKGMALLRLPVPSRELEITVTDSDGNVAYLSRREKVRSGNAVLSSPIDGDLVASYYKFGPGRSPTIQLLKLSSTTPDDTSDAGKITTDTKWTSRTLDFKAADSSLAFTWRYRHERLVASDKAVPSRDQYLDDGGSDSSHDGTVAKGQKKNLEVQEQEQQQPSTSGCSRKQKQEQKKKRTVLALEVTGAHKDDPPIRVAQLLRNRETRTEGTKRCTAGNGGSVLIDETASRAAGISEELVVASCIMMLKREMDRRRAAQFAMLAGAAGGH